MVLNNVHVWPGIMRGMEFFIVMQIKRQFTLKLLEYFTKIASAWAELVVTSTNPITHPPTGHV